MNDLSRHNREAESDERLYALALRYFDGITTDEENESLFAELRSDAESRAAFVTLCRQLGMIREAFSAESAETDAEAGEAFPSFAIPSDEIVPVVFATPDAFSTSRLPVGPMLFSYAVSALFICVALLGAWLYRISPDYPSIARPVLQKNNIVHGQPEQYIGRITGMKDCVWPKDALITMPGASVPLGREYLLDSGLLEITYESGARVILEGPCRYTADSRDGGYLRVGKLVARVEKRGERRGERGEKADGLVASATSAKPQAANPESPAPSPRPLFSVRTPTAIVTDLGTEFGVNVKPSGETFAHVFQGRVSVATSPNDLQKRPAVLYEGESASVIHSDKTGHPMVTRLDRNDGLGRGLVRAIPPLNIRNNGDDYSKLVLSLKPTVYYRMEKPSSQADRSTVFDSTSGGNNGELHSGRINTSYSVGRFGYAINLAGPRRGEYAVVPDYPKTENDSLTVSAWVLAKSRPRRAIIASNWGYPDLTGQFHFGLFHDGNLAACITQHNGERVEISEKSFTLFPLRAWQHVAMVCDGSVLRLYRNGEEVASGECNGIMPKMPTASLAIGCKINDAGTSPAAPENSDAYSAQEYFWHGMIDELAIFNRPLSAKAIKQLSLGQKTNNPATK